MKAYYLFKFLTSSKNWRQSQDRLLVVPVPLIMFSEISTRRALNRDFTQRQRKTSYENERRIAHQNELQFTSVLLMAIYRFRSQGEIRIRKT